MMSQEALGKLCEKFEDCGSVSFANIDTGIVMLTYSQTGQKRDVFMALCKEAADLIGNNKHGSICSEGIVPKAIIRSLKHSKIFLRHPTIPTDVLCCICSPTIDADAFCTHALETLVEISQAED